MNITLIPAYTHPPTSFLKGGCRKVLLNIIYGGKIVETGRSDLKKVFLGFWTLFRSERPVLTIFPPYIMSNGVYEKFKQKMRYPPFKCLLCFKVKCQDIFTSFSILIYHLCSTDNTLRPQSLSSLKRGRTLFHFKCQLNSTKLDTLRNMSIFVVVVKSRMCEHKMKTGTRIVHTTHT